MVSPKKRGGEPGPSVTVMVVGDFGRSPRMQYHTLSLANHGYMVDVLATKGSLPLKEIRSNSNIKLHLIPDVKLEYMPRIIRLPLKAFLQIFLLLWNLFFVISKPKFILVQNPPSVPALPCAWLAARLRSSKLVVDWHNYGYSILSINLRSESHLLVRFYRWIEFAFGSKADAAFCVSKAMKSDLEERFNIKNANVLYDKPPSIFKPVDWRNDTTEVHKLLVSLANSSGLRYLARNPSDTVLTKLQDNKVVRKTELERPFLLLSSTSWTEDEDFRILLSALQKYDMAADASAPSILCIVTGKGPQKEFYLDKISKMQMTKVTIVTPWLAVQDYPRVVALCDIGVCLHKSSSAVDLPMKIVDMFGSGVPVLACDYKCIRELVKPEETGLLFESSDQLCRLLLKMCSPNSASKLSHWRDNVISWQQLRWERNWDNVALNVLKDL